MEVNDYNAGRRKRRKETVDYIQQLKGKIAVLEAEVGKKELPKRSGMTGLEIFNELGDAITHKYGGNEVVLDLGGMLAKVSGVSWGPQYIELKLGMVISR